MEQKHKHTQFNTRDYKHTHPHIQVSHKASSIFALFNKVLNGLNFLIPQRSGYVLVFDKRQKQVDKLVGVRRRNHVQNFRDKMTN